VRRSRRKLAKFLAIPVAAAGITSATVFAASPAFADVADSGGSAAVTEPFSYIAKLAKGGVAEVPLPPATVTVDKTAQTVTTTFPGNGGNANTATISGALNLSGTIKVISVSRHGVHVLTLTNVQLSLDDGAIEATPKGSTTPVILLDLTNLTVDATPNPDGTSTDTATASDLLVDPAGAAYLDSALHTSAFVAGDDAGSLSATWTTSGS
jgi:hypothetical protein